MKGWRITQLWLVALPGCDDQSLPEPTLAEVSQQVQFQSVDALGSHKYLASIVRSEHREGVVVGESQEVFEIEWQGWDDFEVIRSVDGQRASATRVVDGVAWLQRSTGWLQRPDAEPYRQELRLTWSGWDQAMDGYDDRVAYLDAEDGVVEGRPATRYTVALKPLPTMGKAQRRRRERDGGPVSLKGFVWVDQTTAVRLVADVEGESSRGGVVRKIHLKLARSKIGEPRQIVAPTNEEVLPSTRLTDAMKQRSP